MLGALVLALSLVPAASAQEHDHMMADSGIVIAHDVPPDGRVYVGDLAHFEVVDLGKDLVPDFHQQNHARVTLDGAVLYETTPDSGHDYDGTHGFDVVFPATGRYAVEALDDMGMALARFEGTVVAPAAGPSDLVLEVPDAAQAGQPQTFTFRTLDGDGQIVPHSDALFEVRQGSTVLFRTKTHTHEEDQSLQYAFPAPGTYTVRVTDYLSYPSGKEALDFAPKTVEATVTVSPSPPALPGAPAMPDPMQGMNDVAMGQTQGGNYTLVGTFDPYTLVGPNTMTRLSALVLDPATKQLVQHVDFEATLLGPTGQTLFASDTLHEYDGILEVATVQPLPGTYRLVVDASRGGWSGHVELSYTVLPPVEPVAVDVPPQPGVGPILFDVSGLDGAKAGAPLGIGLFGHTLTGQPFPHSEVDVQVLNATGVPVLATKLHTHSDGRFAFTAGLPEGDYTLALSPFPLGPTATPVFYGSEVGSAPAVSFTVGPGPGFEPSAPAGTGAAAAKGAPGLPPLAMLAGVAAVALALRRRD
jgi:hypothetical protein